ncbi:MAG: hypothetical protein H0X17_01730 [Deltaproteobacteria bacterium]|nr:hypothetical protein [Deltaproteobacteria bacterium]
MRTLTLVMLVSLVTAPLAGCLVRSGHGHHNGHSSARRGGGNCGPAYHWNGHRCEHNGRGHAKGHRK